jgi:hypothetical protein
MYFVERDRVVEDLAGSFPQPQPSLVSLRVFPCFRVPR